MAPPEERARHRLITARERHLPHPLPHLSLAHPLPHEREQLSMVRLPRLPRLLLRPLSQPTIPTFPNPSTRTRTTSIDINPAIRMRSVRILRRGRKQRRHAAPPRPGANRAERRRRRSAGGGRGRLWVVAHLAPAYIRMRRAPPLPLLLPLALPLAITLVPHIRRPRARCRRRRVVKRRRPVAAHRHRVRVRVAHRHRMRVAVARVVAEVCVRGRRVTRVAEVRVGATRRESRA